MNYTSNILLLAYYYCLQLRNGLITLIFVLCGEQRAGSSLSISFIKSSSNAVENVKAKYLTY